MQTQGMVQCYFGEIPLLLNKLTFGRESPTVSAVNVGRDDMDAHAVTYDVLPSGKLT